MISFQQHFQARNADIILSTFPKSGTTWLKALVFAILNRTRYPLNSDSHPLINSNPHDLVPTLELNIYKKDKCPNLKQFHDPRIFATHAGYSMLPRSILDSSCRIIYICRNPLDQLISAWCFFQKVYQDGVALEKVFELACEGVHNYGPFWDHVLGYWEASLKKPGKILFLKYEDLKRDITSQSKKLADFLGFPFSQEEEQLEVIDDISTLCSFDTMKEMEVNKTSAQNSNYFRNAKVGDWTNYLTPSMAQQFIKVNEEKFKGSGITFEMDC
ncbi:hypothetical protein NMG60_11029506 [Bertholletia excelsa]